LPHISNPGQAGAFSSRLSPHLAFGSLSEREVFHGVSDYLNIGKDRLSRAALKGGRSVLTRLSWRSHFIQKLEDQPEIEIQLHASNVRRDAPEKPQMRGGLSHGQKARQDIL
jgi:deoxyribodipyrimidine photo-lyase